MSTTTDRAIEEAAASVAGREWRLLLAGEARPASGGRTYDVECPATEELIAEAPDASIDDVDAAVRCAADAAPAWRAVDVRERGRRLQALAEAIRAHADELALLDAVDSGPRGPRCGRRRMGRGGARFVRRLRLAPGRVDDSRNAGEPALHAENPLWCGGADRALQPPGVLRRLEGGRAADGGQRGWC